MVTWGDLFERAETHPTTVATVRATLAERRSGDDEHERTDESGDGESGGAS